MAGDRIDPSELIPEADLLEQHTPLDPGSLTDPDRRTDVEPGSAIAEASGDAVDEADRLEQHAPVFGDDEDYPHEIAGLGSRDGGPARRGGGAGVCRFRRPRHSGRRAPRHRPVPHRPGHVQCSASRARRATGLAMARRPARTAGPRRPGETTSSPSPAGPSRFWVGYPGAGGPAVTRSVKARRTGTGRFYLLLPAAPMLQINRVLDCDSYFAQVGP